MPSPPQLSSNKLRYGGRSGRVYVVHSTICQDNLFLGHGERGSFWSCCPNLATAEDALT
jgi:hypothetical protein